MPSPVPRYPRNLPGPPGGYKGALHCHTTTSDGRKTADQLIAIYRELGFSFLCVTDHSTAGRHGGMRGKDFLVVDGLEANARLGSGAAVHVVAINVSGLSLGLIVGLRRLREALLPKGAVLFAAHPHWTDNSPEDICLQGFHGVEVFNYACQRENGKGSGLCHWDHALARGEDLLGFAVDDTHGREALPDWGGGWVRVFARRLDKRGILRALRRGLFYSSNGPVIYRMRLSRDTFTAVTSPVTIARLVGYNGYHRVAAPSPAPEQSDRLGCPAMTVSLKLPTPEELQRKYRYLRFDCQDEHTGKSAWTNTLLRLVAR